MAKKVGIINVKLIDIIKSQNKFFKNNKKSKYIKSKKKNSKSSRIIKKALKIESDEHQLKMKAWLIYENNSCRYDCFLTLFAFVIKPFLPKEIIEADEDLNKLNYITDLLNNNPDKKYRNNFGNILMGKDMTGLMTKYPHLV